MIFLLALLLVGSSAIPAHAAPAKAAADNSVSTPEAATASVTSARSDYSGSDLYDQVLSISAGPFTPRSAVISNKSYTFDYGNGPNSASSSFLIEAGWGIRIVDTRPGSFYVSENIAYSRFSGSRSSESINGVSDTSLSANLIGLDTRLNYSIEHFPLRWFIPFGEGGYQYTFYSQTGSSDLDSVQGGTGNFVAAAGVRLWVNRHASMDSDLQGVYSSIPFFLVLKYNRIFSNGASLDLAESAFMGGLSIGL